MDIDILQAPRLTDADVIRLGRPLIDAATKSATVYLTSVANRDSPRGIQGTWVPEVRMLGGVQAMVAVTTHPGALPLNFGAQWGGSMPPWAPGTPLAVWANQHNIPPFLVARALQRRGLQPRLFAGRAFNDARPRLAEILRQEAVQRWMTRFSRG